MKWKKKGKKNENWTLCQYRSKTKRIAEGSGEKMRKPGTAGAPTAKAFKQAAKTAKPKKK
jgi:hypothetical protein